MMKNYDSYTNTGIEWLNEIPSHWSKVRLRYLCDITTGNRDTVHREDEGQYPFFVRSKTIEKISTFSYDGEAILTAGDGDICKIWHHVNEKFDFHQRVYMLYNFKKLNGRFLYYYISENFYYDVFKLSAKNTVDSLRLPMFLNFPVSVPPIQEQNKIAQYLDHQTAIIDQLIQQKEKLIELLKEKRQAVINESVTKGLNPNTKMKDSGIEWLGDVPEHWEVTKMKYMATITRGAILRPVDDPEYFDDNGEWTYLNISDATKCDKYLHEGKLRLSELGSTKSARVLPDNLILTASATIGKPFINKIPVCVHDGFIPITNIKCSIDYLYHYLRNPQLYVALGKVNTQKNIYLDEVKDMFVTQPPLNEQIDIVGFLEKFEETNNELILQVENQIDKLNEYRQSIVSEAVTGKIDVRDWQPNKQTTA
jgi:type I restriction enzyme S subunit